MVSDFCFYFHVNWHLENKFGKFKNVSYHFPILLQSFIETSANNYFNFHKLQRFGISNIKMPRTKVKKQVANQSTKENKTAAAAFSENYEGLCKFLFFLSIYSYSISDLRRIEKNLIFMGFQFPFI